MANRLFAIFALFVVTMPAWAGNYTVTIDGKDHEFDLGKPQTVTLPDGRAIKVSLAKKDIVKFTAKTFSFDHSSRFAPARTDLGDGVHQTMLVSPLGTLVMVQEYNSLDPSLLIDLMVRELTKEEVEYGYKIKKTDVTQTLPDGTKLTGKVVTSSHKDTEYIRHIVVHKTRDAGVMVITQIEKTAASEEKQLLDLFWKTLKVSLK